MIEKVEIEIETKVTRCKSLTRTGEDGDGRQVQPGEV